MKSGIPNASSQWIQCAVAALLITLVASSHCLPNESTRILVLPFRVGPSGDEAVLQEFSDHLDDRVRTVIGLATGNYSIEPRDFAEKLLKGNPPPASDEEAQAIARESGSDLIIYGLLSADDEGYRMRGAMWDSATNRVTVSTDVKVANIHALPGILQFFITGLSKRLQGSSSLPFYQEQSPSPSGSAQTSRIRNLVSIPSREGPWRSQEISGALRGLAIGDFHGDKRNDTAFVGDSGITISRFEASGLKSLTHFAQSPAAYLSVQAEDLDGDGVAELIVCYQAPTGVASQIIRYVNRNIRLTDSFPNMILAATEDPLRPDRKILVGQKTDTADMFNGEMILFSIRDGKAEPDGAISFPPGTLLLSYASGFFGDKKEFLKVILNQDQRLMVFDAENKLLSVLSDRIYGFNQRIRVQSAKGPKDIVWPGRLLVSDANGDGGKELLVVKNFEGKSEIHALAWDGQRFTKKWNTSSVQGTISDFSIQDFKNNGIQSLVFLLVRSDPFLALSGPRTIVFAYDFIR